MTDGLLKEIWKGHELCQHFLICRKRTKPLLHMGGQAYPSNKKSMLGNASTKPQFLLFYVMFPVSPFPQPPMSLLFIELSPRYVRPPPPLYTHTLPYQVTACPHPARVFSPPLKGTPLNHSRAGEPVPHQTAHSWYGCWISPLYSRMLIVPLEEPGLQPVEDHRHHLGRGCNSGRFHIGSFLTKQSQ